MNKLYMVRHGQTDWNVNGIIQGSTDIELNGEGIRQAKELAMNIDLSKIDVCISSPLKRARKTAEILTSGNKEIIYDDLLVERSFGDYEGKKMNFDLLSLHCDYNLNDSSNNIESIRDCLLRAKIFLNKIKENYPDKSILIVSHGCLIKALHFNILGYDTNTDFLSFNPMNTTLYTYDLE